MIGDERKIWIGWSDNKPAIQITNREAGEIVQTRAITFKSVEEAELVHNNLGIFLEHAKPEVNK